MKVFYKIIYLYQYNRYIFQEERIEQQIIVKRRLCKHRIRTYYLQSLVGANAPHQ